MTMPPPSTSSEDPPSDSKSWTGNIWIKDEWTDQDKSEARDRLVAVAVNNGASSSTKEQEQVEQQLVQQRKLTAFNEFRRNASTNWNVFYSQNKTNFFKDRHYLHKAFPKEFGWLYAHDHDDDDQDAHAIMSTKENVTIVEIGCGVGNAILPLLEQHTELMSHNHCNAADVDGSPTIPPTSTLNIHCLDFAPTAIQLLKEDARFKSAAMEGRATGHVYDLSSMHPSTISTGGEDEHSNSNSVLAQSADVAILLFCLSAIGPHPSPSLDRAARHVIDMLKPGGTLVLRDYGRLDEAQMKLGMGDKELGDNFYRKGDGTGCYYFELEDLKDLFVNKDVNDNKLELLELDYIQRVYRNRGDGTTRRRVWIQGRFRKPLSSSTKAPAAVADKRVSSANHGASWALEQYLDASVDSWNHYYKSLSNNASASSSPLPSSNLFQMFPNEFERWVSLQSSNGKGKRHRPPPYKAQSETPLLEATVIDLGCGLGNNVLLDAVEKQQLLHDEKQQLQEGDQPTPTAPELPPTLNVHFLDASNEALQQLQSDPRYQHAAGLTADKGAPPAASIKFEVYDLASTQAVPAHLEHSADIVLLLFTLSAIGPYPQQQHHFGMSEYSRLIAAVHNAVSMLKPGGVILFRDYGRFDDDQLQLNSVVGAQICDNFYIRGSEDASTSNDDKSLCIKRTTACYFFDIDEVRELFTKAGLEIMQLEYVTRVYKKSGKKGRDCSKNGGAVERRRIWINGRFRIPTV